MFDFSMSYVSSLRIASLQILICFSFLSSDILSMSSVQIDLSHIAVAAWLMYRLLTCRFDDVWSVASNAVCSAVKRLAILFDGVTFGVQTTC